MGSMQRIRHILAANVNNLLDRVEDPQKMLRALLKEMDDARIEAEKVLKDLKRERESLTAESDKVSAEVQGLTAQAEAALAAGDDELARRKLSARHDLRGQVEATREAVATAQRSINAVESDLTRLAERREMAMARVKKEALASEQRQVQRRYQSAAGRCIDRTDEVIERLEARIDRMTAEAEVLEATSVPTVGPQVEAELEQLRERVRSAG